MTSIVSRTPGSELVLPANPLMGITDESLEGFIDCTIFEETGNFFPVEPAPTEDPADPVAPPPMFAPITSARPAVVPPPELAAELPDDHVMISSGPPVEHAPAPMYMQPPMYAQPPLQYPLAPPLEYPLATPPFATDALGPEPMRPLRRGEVTAAIGVPHTHDPKRLYLIGAIAFVVIATIVIVAAAKSSAASKPAPTTSAPITATEPVHAVPPSIEPPRIATAAQARAVVAETHPVEPEEPQVAGTPVVGKGPCRMTIVTTPAGSTLALDGRALGPSPLTIDGACQRRQLTVSHARYQSFSRWVAPIDGKPDSIDVVLERPTHSLMVETAPLGATISIGGRRAGTSPTVVELMGFSTIAITISKPGFATMTKRIYSKKPNDKLFVRLTRQ